MLTDDELGEIKQFLEQLEAQIAAPINLNFPRGGLLRAAWSNWLAYAETLTPEPPPTNKSG